MSASYIHEKIRVAIEVMMGARGTFEERLEFAMNSALSRLQERNAEGDFAMDLLLVLAIIKRQIKAGGGFEQFSDDDRRKLSEGMVNVLVKIEQLRDDSGNLPE